jgi:penicillin-binding protein 1C
MVRVALALALTLVGAAATVTVAVTSFVIDDGQFDPGQGGPLVVLDREGRMLQRIPAADGRPGRAHWVPLSAIDSHAVQTLLASEDQNFYSHRGVDLLALGRAAWLNLTTDRWYGGSTITMQLARQVYGAGAERTVWAKFRELRAALAMERHFTKDFILEQYLNRVYFGHGAYGIESAARRYFGKPAASLSVGESTLLMVLPRSPGRYDPLQHQQRALQRRDHLLGLLLRQGRLSPPQAARAREQQLQLQLTPFPYLAPHFVEWVLDTLPDDVRRRGGLLHTSLDLPLQQALERETAEHVRQTAPEGVQQAGVVVLDPDRAAVLAMVGSRQHDAPGGALNITTWRRYPGSALKPFVYAAAIERGASPATVAFDVEDISPDYRPRGRPERGPVSYREALASSYNFAAVHVLAQVGLPEVMNRLFQAGVAPLPQRPAAYGPQLALGAAKVTLLELAAGYRFLVRQGLVLAPRGVDEVVFGDGSRWRPPASREERVFSDQTSWLVLDMLADADARRPMFGEDLPVDLPFAVAAKTGTAEGLADAVTVLATNEFIVASWAGRFDGRATFGHPAMVTTAPLARSALLLASGGQRLTLPDPPPGVVTGEVCPLSGLRPSRSCPHRRRDFFVDGNLPRQHCHWHRPHGVLRYPSELQSWQWRRHGGP